MTRIVRYASPRRWLVALALAAFAAGGAAADAQKAGMAATPESVEITIDNFTFTPAEITITPGTTVRWVNHDDIPHTVAESNKSFRSKTLDTDDSFTTTFTSIGSFAYFCSLHPHMTGKVIVKEGSSTRAGGMP
jgi:plastocyanin